MADANESTRSMIRVGGVVLLVVGIILFIIGISLFMTLPDTPSAGDEDFPGFDTSKQTSGMIMSVIGFFCFGGGVTLLRLSFVGKYASYIASETQEAVGITGRAVGSSIASGIRDSGGFQMNVSGNSHQNPKEVVKVKCRECGYLDSEDASYCSKCGSRL